MTSCHRLIRFEMVVTVIVGVAFVIVDQAGELGYVPKDSGRVFWLAVVPAWLIGGRLDTWVHELAHALAAVALTGSRVLVTIPTKLSVDRFAIGRIDFSFSPSERIAAAHALGPVGRRARFVIAAAGPLGSGLVGACGTALALACKGGPAIPFWIGAIVALHGAFGFLNLIPMRVPRTFPGAEGTVATDGYRLLAAVWPRFADRLDEPPRPATAPADDTGDWKRKYDFTPGATTVRSALVLASEFGHDTLATEHVLAALAGSPDAAPVFQSAAVDPEIVRTRSLERYPRGVRRPTEFKVTPAAIRVFRGALGLVALGRQPRVGPPHVLLALTQDASHGAADVLRELGVDIGALRRATLAAIS